MWEAYGLEDEALLWAGPALRGGLAGQQTGTCGAAAAAGVCLGFRHQDPLADQEGVEKAREAAFRETRELADAFIEEYGAITCLDLIGMDLSGEGAFERARESGIFERKCHEFVRFVVRKLYEIEEKRAPER